MRTNKHIPEVDPEWEEAKRRFREACRAGWRRRPKMMAIQIDDELMSRAIELNAASLKLIATDPETGMTVMRRPYAATGGTAVMLEAGKNLDVWAVVRR
jgi:hypothetical protein